MTKDAGQHWDGVYAGTAADEVSWFQPRPETSLRLVASVSGPTDSVLDVGAGASTLADELLGRGWRDVTVLDVSAEALALASSRRADREPSATLVVADLLEWVPERTYDLWHDRAVLHFLTRDDDRARYVLTAAGAVRPGGHLVVGTFADDGPTTCSGLPTARYSAAGLAAVFGGAFEPVHAEREEHQAPSGAVQAFTWVVLRHRWDPGPA